MGKQYGNESMRKQDDREACRTRIPTYFGTTELKGAFQSLKEILSNAIDEEKVKDPGKKGKVKVTIHKDNSLTVEDEGRGLPLDWNKKEKCYNAELVLSTLHAGGKFDDNRDNFKDSTGMNGLGLTVTALSSKWIKVESRRDGYIYHIEMKEGYYSVDNNVEKSLKKEKDPKGKNQKTGTIISWKCDTEEVFLDDNFILEDVKEWVNLQAILADEVTIELKDERCGFKQDYCYKNGLRTFVESKVSDPKKIVEFEFKGSGKDSPNQKKVYEVRGRVLFAFVEDGKNTDSMWYHNSLPMTLGGSPKNAEQKAFMNFFSKKCKDSKKLDFDDIQESLIFYSNTLTQEAPVFKNQTKDALGMPFIEACLQSNLEKQLNQWAKDNPMELDKVVQQIEANSQARLTSANVKQLTKEKLSGKIKLSNNIKKFEDCRSKDPNERELFIAEGDSAKGSLMKARNAQFQALMPIRGKILNTLKCDYGTIFKNELIMDLMKLVGTGIQMDNVKKNSQAPQFDINNRKFDKYIIASDQDIDGFHIICLCLTMFYKLTPELIKQGKVYFLDTPLFDITVKNKNAEGGKEVIYAFSDEEKEKIMKEKGHSVVDVKRNKGLGEVSAKTMAKFLNPATRRLTRVTLQQAAETAKMFELWMSEQSDVRQVEIEAHGAEVASQIETE